MPRTIKKDIEFQIDREIGGQVETELIEPVGEVVTVMYQSGATTKPKPPKKYKPPTPKPPTPKPPTPKPTKKSK